MTAGCTRSSTTAFASLPERTASGSALQPPRQRPDPALYPIVDAVARLKARTCIIDGEAVACGTDGVALFDLIRYRRHDERVFLCAFDLIELNGDDLRREPLISRKATLSIALAGAGSGIELNEHLEHGDGSIVFEHACKLGLEGIVSKHKDSRYVSGRSPHWIKLKNPACAAVKREAEEEWGR